VRRTAGGAVQPFPAMPQSVHVIYQAGQSTVPSNVYEGTLELIRVNFQHTQQALRAPGPFPLVDDGSVVGSIGPSMGFFVPNRVRELLSPTRRFPSLA
jgi:hypothetical protein